MSIDALKKLRRRHPQFIYQDFSYQLRQGQLQITFNYRLKPNIEFNPTITIDDVGRTRLAQVDEDVLERLIFFLGLAEIPSYWKAACSPEIVIKAGKISQKELRFWWNLLLKGLGEFFYQNQIDFTQVGFLRWHFEQKEEPESLNLQTPLSIVQGALHKKQKEMQPKKRLVPVGGGKDSALVLGLLDQADLGYSCLILSTLTDQLPAAQAVAEASSAEQIIQVQRQIDPQLLKLNSQGYLNGHVPFSAYLSFLSLLIAYLWDFDQILVGNERSANQGNLTYRGQEINHQYSKTFDYEQNFRRYLINTQSDLKKASQINYFSVLKPLYELQIAQLFSQDASDYHQYFNSCNQGQKKGVWCHHCPKCLFVFTLLYPFFSTKKLTTQIFQKNLFENQDLIETALDLVGYGDAKPFECVGTFEESLIAFYLAVKKETEASVGPEELELPPVLAAIQKQVLSKEKKLDKRAKKLLESWNKQHNLPKKLAQFLKSKI